MSATERWRLFVALFPPTAVVQFLADTTRRVAAGLSPNAVAWTSPEQIHLTLNFLGGTAREKIEALEKMLDEVCRAEKTHLLAARGLGCFPNPGRPRIIWAGFPDPPPALISLKKKLDHGLTALGYAGEDRPFHPHLTLGRVKDLKSADRQHLAQALRELRDAEFGRWTVDRVDLMRSVLSPSGACYSVVKSFPLLGRI
jgi:RNA 2',3'-cyclic 3'-phosphodiesterase